MGTYKKDFINVFSLKIDDINMEQYEARVRTNKGFGFVVTPNVQHVVELHKNNVLMECYKQASICLCDSRVLQLVSQLFSYSINNVIPGSDLTKYMLEKSIIRSEKIMVVGSTKNDIEIIRDKYDLTNLSHYEPPMGFIHSDDEIDKTIDNVMKAKPSYLFLALGFPRQEMLACRLKQRIDFNCLAFCIGASIDFLTGKQKRAPKVWQYAKLEWLYRFTRQPKRLFRRYFLESWGLVPIIIREVLLRYRL